MSYLSNIQIIKLYNQAVEALYLGDYQQAKNTFREVLTIEESFQEAINNLGVVYYYEGNYSEAVKQFNAALKLNNKNAEFWNNRGISSEKTREYNGSFIEPQKRYQIAIQCFDEAIELDKGFLKSYVNKIKALVIINDYSKALETIEIALKQQPKTPMLWYLRGQCFAELEEFQEMNKSFKVLNALKPDFNMTDFQSTYISPKLLPDIEEELTYKADHTSDQHVSSCILCTGNLDSFGRCQGCQEYCSICQKAIAVHDKYNWTTCYNCGFVHHKNHLRDYITQFGECPNCRKTLNLIEYSVGADVTEKLSSLVQQSVRPSKTQFSEDQVYEATYVSELLSAILYQLIYTKSDVNTSYQKLSQKIDEIDASARQRHQMIIEELKPISKEILLIKTFVNEIDAKTLSYEEFYRGINSIQNQFSVMTEHLNLLVEAHKKSKSLLKKVETLLLAGGKELSGVVMSEIGFKDKLARYLRLPNTKDLKSIFGTIGKNISATAKNPLGWLKLASLLLV